MKNLFVILLCTACSVYAQKKVILDTDPSYDPDDMGCMAMLHTMASQGECEILAIMNSMDQKESPLCISAVNTFYNRKAIPVGDYMGYEEKKDAPEVSYDFHIARDYPRMHKTWEDIADGVKLYREILESAADSSITIIVVGTMHNLYGLLASEPDAISSMTGKQLVADKVALVVTMGGNFLDHKGFDRTNWGGSDHLCSYTEWSCLKEERNRMCRYVIENCPAPFMASGWENGNGNYYNAGNGDVITGQGLKALPEDHIIRMGYEWHFKYNGSVDDIRRHSNDQCALQYAVRGAEDNYVAYTDGKITLTEKGVCSWEDVNGGIQGHIQKKREDELIAREIEALMLGEVPQLDRTPPTRPENVRVQQENGHSVLVWEASTDPDKGSWVVAYNLYKQGELIHQAYGTRFLLSNTSIPYEIRAVNASGTLSAPAFYHPK